jgi:hypothetical protein
VILISGVGLLLLSMTNRYGRIIDRSRIIARDLRHENGIEQQRARAQVDILWRRAQLVRLAIALGATSVLLASLLVIVIFIGALTRLALAGLIVGLFSGCLLTLIGSLLAFIREINESLSALKVDLFGG